MESCNDLEKTVNALEMNFIELSEYIAELEAQISQYKIAINQYEAMVSEYNRDAEIRKWTDRAAERAAEARDWRQIASDLADAMDMVEDQLGGLGVGLRPLAQAALLAYREQFERFESQ